VHGSHRAFLPTFLSSCTLAQRRPTAAPATDHGNGRDVDPVQQDARPHSAHVG